MPVRLAALALLCLAGVSSAQSPGLDRPQPIGPRLAAKAVPVPPPPSTQAPSTIMQARYQPPPRLGMTLEEQRQTYQIQVEPPGLERLQLSLTNDPDLQERIRQETLTRVPNERVTFPEEPILSRERYFGRGGIWPQRGVIVVPNYTCYNKLYFEDKNSERYGWELGLLQPFISTGLFFYDFALFPMHCLADPCNKNDCSVGHCMPGDPVPYRLYPLEITPLGVAGEVAAILALVVIFP
jgi:hypothetical protein